MNILIMLAIWFACYVIKNATSAVSSRMFAYVFNNIRGRICGKIYPTLSRGKCYVIIRGDIVEIDVNKKYCLADGLLTEKIEDNWLAL